jgi:hypothetical protein
MTEHSSTGHSGRLSGAVALMKDIFALLRDSSLFAVALLLLAFPATFNAILTSAGFEEGSFAGLKWKRQFFDTDTALRTAQATITSLQTQNADLLRALAAAEASTGDAKQREELARLQLESQKTVEAAKQVQASVRATLATNDPLIEKARLAKATDTPPSLAYCYQEDRLEAGPQRYSVHCHATLAGCEAARGPNPRTKQSPCTAVPLDEVQWAPRHPGWMGSWYEFRSVPFGPPFPQIGQ